MVTFPGSTADASEGADQIRADLLDLEAATGYDRTTGVEIPGPLDNREVPFTTDPSGALGIGALGTGSPLVIAWTRLAEPSHIDTDDDPDEVPGDAGPIIFDVERVTGTTFPYDIEPLYTVTLEEDEGFDELDLSELGLVLNPADSLRIVLISRGRRAIKLMHTIRVA